MCCIQSTKEETIVVPVSIFRDRTLAPLETISEYLKDVKGLSYHEIALLLNRDDRTIWTCYNRAKKKQTKQTPDKQTDKHTEKTANKPAATDKPKGVSER